MIKSPINIPNGYCGECKVIHDHGSHVLLDQNGVWMSDSQKELELMTKAVQEVNASGRGLVGGLGLGIVTELLGAKKEVTYINVVEKSKEVINLVAPNLSCRDKVNIITDDIYDFLEKLEFWTYDFAIFDTWQGDSAETWLIKVMPIRRSIANKFGKQNIHCWMEDKMKVELLEILTNKEPYWILDQLPMPMDQDSAMWFIDNVGLPEWEKLYGEKIKRKSE